MVTQPASDRSYLSVQKRKKTERSKKIKVMTHSNDTGKEKSRYDV